MLVESFFYHMYNLYSMKNFRSFPSCAFVISWRGLRFFSLFILCFLGTGNFFTFFLKIFILYTFGFDKIRADIQRWSAVLVLFCLLIWFEKYLEITPYFIYYYIKIIDHPTKSKNICVFVLYWNNHEE